MVDEGTPAESEPVTEQASTVAHPSPERLYRTLRDATRRKVLYLLLGESSVSATELTDVLAGWQAPLEGMVGPEERHDIAVSLHHVHLPMLVDANLVEVDAEGDTEVIRLSSLSPPTRQLIDAARTYDRDLVMRTLRELP